MRRSGHLDARIKTITMPWGKEKGHGDNTTHAQT